LYIQFEIYIRADVRITLKKGIITLLIRLNIEPDIKQKLKDKHQVKAEEIEECFLNREKGYLEDTRADHVTDPPTRWFIAETDVGRLLKVVWIKDEVAGITIKTAYEPNAKEIEIYTKHA